MGHFNQVQSEADNKYNLCNILAKTDDLDITLIFHHVNCLITFQC